MFREEETEYGREGHMIHLDRQFTQRPMSIDLPIIIERRPRIMMVQEKQDYTPLILGLTALAFFGFLAFLATRHKG